MISHISFWRILRGCICVACVGLTACASSQSVGPMIPDPLNFGSTQAALDESRLIYEGSDFNATLLSDLPDGSVTYSGYAYTISDSTDVDVATEVSNDPLFAVGRATITADFDSSAISGTASNFIDGNNNQVAGQLTLTATVIPDFGQPQITNSVIGQIVGQIGTASGGTFNYDTEVSGAVNGPNGEGVIVYAGDTVAIPDGSGVSVATPFVIGFVGHQ